MVRKRSRRSYDSDENDSDDSDLNFEVEEAPARKKYSLRERKSAPLLTEDFDYYGLDEEDAAAKKQSSDDEDFEVEGGGEEIMENYVVSTEPENSGLIDFEDIIRADIVVNRNNIDYDNLIQKTEIKLTRKRGKKPKTEPKEEEPDDQELTCQPELSPTLSTNVEDAANVEDQDDKAAIEGVVQKEEQEGQSAIFNGDKLLDNNTENGEIDKIDSNTTDVLAPEKSNSEITNIEPLVTNKEVGSKPTVPIDCDDDDVIVLEDKDDVIVLDDD